MPIELTTEQAKVWDRDEKDGGLVTEISTLSSIPGNIGKGTVFLPGLGMFPLSRMAKDMQGDEIAGWRYTDPATRQKYLVVND